MGILRKGPDLLLPLWPKLWSALFCCRSWGPWEKVKSIFMKQKISYKDPDLDVFRQMGTSGQPRFLCSLGKEQPGWRGMGPMWAIFRDFSPGPLHLRTCQGQPQMCLWEMKIRRPSSTSIMERPFPAAFQIEPDSYWFYFLGSYLGREHQKWFLLPKSAGGCAASSSKPCWHLFQDWGTGLTVWKGSDTSKTPGQDRGGSPDSRHGPLRT